MPTKALPKVIAVTLTEATRKGFLCGHVVILVWLQFGKSAASVVVEPMKKWKVVHVCKYRY